ncbi:FAD binding domain-containing protein [Phlebopus sp. FC_14]|nr:FAD binding domain-containing protein [Phlebopus sp. FC_14]
MFSAATSLLKLHVRVRSVSSIASMASPSLPVLVAGAGPSGLVAALTLLRNGTPVRIIDKESEPRIGQRGPGIFPRSFEVFHFLDVPQIHKEAAPLLMIRAYKPGTMDVLNEFYMSPYTEPTPAIPYYNPKLIGQQKLEGILRARLEEYNCHVEFGAELCSFEQNEERVIAHIVKKENGNEVSETIEASFLIGADGARGVTRKQLGLTFLGETRDDVRLLLGDIRLTSEKLDRDHWHFFGQSLVLRPTNEVGDNGFQFIVIPGEGNGVQEMVHDNDKLMSFIHNATGLSDIKLDKLNWISEFRPNIRMADKFGVGRIFVAGDAAHVHSPTGGQGLNSSVQDASNIAWKVALVHKGLSPSSLLETYSKERIPVIAEMLNLTTELLNKGLGTDGASVEDAFTRGRKLYMLGVNYRYSPVVVDEFSQTGPVNAYGMLQSGVLVAGDRAPDAPNLIKVKAEGEETRLFDIFRPAYHTVLIFGTEGDAASSVVGALRPYDKSVVRTVVVLPASAPVPSTTEVDLVLHDEKGHAHDAYLVPKGSTRVVVVRPDGVVGAIVHGGEGVQKYFGNILIPTAA